MSAPFSDLGSLASHLRELVADGHSPIALDNTILDASAVSALSTAFGLANGAALTVNGVKSSDVPAPSDNTLTISTGTASVLKKDLVPITLTFSIDNAALQVLVSATMPKGWAFKDSFSSLSMFPFDVLTISDGAHFVFTTTKKTDYAWPAGDATPIVLAAGQNFLGEVGLGGVSLIATLLGMALGNKTFRFYGPFAPTAGQALPVTTLLAPIVDGTAFSVGQAPNSISLSQPAVGVVIGTADGATQVVQDVDLVLQGIFQDELTVAVSIPPSGTAYGVTTTPLEGKSSIKDIIKSLPGGAAFESYLPTELQDAFSAVGLDYFTMVVDSTPAVTYVGLEISTLKTWTVIPPDVLILDKLMLVIDVIEPAGMNLIQIRFEAKAEFLKNIFAGEFDFTVLLEKQATWQITEVSGAYLGAVNLGDIVQGLLGSSASAPKILHDISFSNFGVTAIRAAPDDPFTYTCYGSADAAFPLLGQQFTAHLNLVFTKSADSYDVLLSGALAIGEQAFTITLDVGTAGSKLTAKWVDSGAPLGFGDIAGAFGWTLPAIPTELDLGLTGASFSYDFTGGTLALTATSKNPFYGDVAFVATPGTSGKNYFFGIRLPESHDINLTNLPLIKNIIPSNETVAVKDIQAVITSGELDAAAAQTINAFLTDAGMPQVPADGLPAGVALSMTFQAGSYTQPLSITTGTKQQQDNAQPLGTQLAVVEAPSGANGASPPATTGAGSNSTVTSSTSPDGTVWYNLQKKFGPVSFQKVGIRYVTGKDNDPSRLFVLMNAGLDAGGLNIGVLGLGVGSPLTSFQPKFNIDGIVVTLAEGPVEVSGGLFGTIDPHVNFYGELVLGFSELTISALGGYAEEDGHPSFFLYAVVDYPIGGPPFFFVTGLAAGLGFNRLLMIPDITGVTTFPLVAWARGNGAPPFDPGGGDAGTQVMNAMTTLATSGVIAPSLGSYWLALGVRFTSFEIVDAFALLTVTFGTRFEVDLLGVATLSIPPKVEPAIAFIELALKASFAPSKGLLSVEGQLTNNSYVLDPAAHLTGGFAFYSWFGGDHEGDFVVTLGGYNPNFKVPDWYPKVPRLGLNWQVIPGQLTIQGDLYFALTSNAVMAGGGMSATWSSGPISAWFTVHADFLMIFKPFHYFISAGIDLGASFTIKILFVHIRLTIHVGVDLQIWGPPFAGVATVHLYIISFDIHFGGGAPQQDTTLAWPDFVKQLIPSTAAKPQQAEAPRFRRTFANPRSVAASAADDAQPAVVQISVTQGLIKTVDTTKAHPWYLVNGETFQCQVSTTIPFKEATFKGIAEIAPDAQQPHDMQGNLIPVNKAFSAGIAGIAAADFNPALTIDVESGEDSTLYGVRVLRNAPKALWETKNFSNGVPQVDPSTGLTNSTVPNTLGGFVLIPEAPDADVTLDVPLPLLEFTLEAVQPYSWSAPTFATTDTFTTQTVANTITDPSVSKVRSALLSALANQSITIDTSVAVDSLADSTNNDLMAEPTRRLLGEERTTTVSEAA